MIRRRVGTTRAPPRLLHIVDISFLLGLLSFFPTSPFSSFKDYCEREECSTYDKPRALLPLLACGARFRLLARFPSAESYHVTPSSI